jgi:hypothetical protein
MDITDEANTNSMRTLPGKDEEGGSVDKDKE